MNYAIKNLLKSKKEKKSYRNLPSKKLSKELNRTSIQRLRKQSKKIK